MKFRIIAIPMAILLVASILFFAVQRNWDRWRGSETEQSTNDAYLAADQIPLSTRVTGTVKRTPVKDFQTVKAGDPIVELETTDYAATVAEAQAAIDVAQAQVAANQNAKNASDASIEAGKKGIEQAEASVVAAQASIAAQQAQANQAESEFRRQEVLLAHAATTRQQFEQVEAARASAEAALDARNADLARAKAAVGASHAALAASLQQRSALNATDAQLKAQIVAKQSGKAITNVNLNFTTIAAPADGRIGKLKVHPGQLVAAGVQVVDFVQNGTWVEANFLETQLEHIRVGNKADVKIDAYPDLDLKGHVAEIAPASGSASALLPPDNATGNFTKVVQRVPVKIALDSQASPELLRPGLSVEVRIHTDQR